MLNDNARKWVEGLRSGEYEQARGALHTSEGYCCLGVACEEYRRETGRGEWADALFGDFRFAVGGVGAVATLPNPVRRWLGLQSERGGLGLSCLAEENDDGKTFAQIADIIESEPEGLFDGH